MKKKWQMLVLERKTNLSPKLLFPLNMFIVFIALELFYWNFVWRGIFIFFDEVLEAHHIYKPLRIN